MAMMQALSAQVIRHKRILSDHCVFIVSSICDGYFHDERWPYLRELYEMFQHDYMQTLPDMNRYGEYFATNEEYIRKYRFANAFHPFHGFSMMSCGHIAEMNTSAIYIVGAREPGIARGMGLKTRATFEEALADAMRMLNENAPNDQVIKLKSLEALQKMADGKATKIIIPSEIQGLAGLAASAKTLLESDPPQE